MLDLRYWARTKCDQHWQTDCTGLFSTCLYKRLNRMWVIDDTLRAFSLSFFFNQLHFCIVPLQHRCNVTRPDLLFIKGNFLTPDSKLPFELNTHTRPLKSLVSFKTVVFIYIEERHCLCSFEKKMSGCEVGQDVKGWNTRTKTKLNPNSCLTTVCSDRTPSEDLSLQKSTEDTFMNLLCK